MKKSFLILFILLAGISVYRLSAQEKKAAEQKRPVFQQTIVNIEYQGTKIWVPSYLIVPKGSRVELKLINNTPSGVHGFDIADFGVKLEVAKGQPKEISFVADKAGLFPISCHLHPAHIGGQLYVVDLPPSSSTQEHKH